MHICGLRIIPVRCVGFAGSASFPSLVGDSSESISSGFNPWLRAVFFAMLETGLRRLP